MSTVTSTTLKHKHRPLTLPGSHAAEPADRVKPSAYVRWKSCLDGALAVLLLLPGLPMIALLAVLVRLTSRGPAIYCQIRAGQNGRQFMMYKIRTMRQDAETISGPMWTQVRDPRITRVGNVLRRLHLDELPQLFNVLKGDMSLVGPRPERPEFIHVLADVVPGYHNRLVVRPGVTGLAQLNLPPDTNLESVHRKLVLDCEYIRKAGLLLDLRLLACTFFRMFKMPEKTLLRIFGLHRNVIVPPLAVTTLGNDGAVEMAELTTPAAILAQALVSPEKAGSNSQPPHGAKKHRCNAIPKQPR